MILLQVRWGRRCNRHCTSWRDQGPSSVAQTPATALLMAKNQPAGDRRSDTRGGQQATRPGTPIPWRLQKVVPRPHRHPRFGRRVAGTLAGSQAVEGPGPSSRDRDAIARRAKHAPGGLSWAWVPEASLGHGTREAPAHKNPSPPHPIVGNLAHDRSPLPPAAQQSTELPSSDLDRRRIRTGQSGTPQDRRALRKPAADQTVSADLQRYKRHAGSLPG